MTRGVFVAASEPGSGKSLVSLGLMELASRQAGRVGFFRPVDRGERTGRQIDLLRRRYQIDREREACCAISYEEARELARAGHTDRVIQRVLDRYAAFAADFDFVVIEGSSYEGVTAAFEFDFNARLAANLGVPVLFVVNGHEKSVDTLLAGAGMAREAFADESCPVVATLVNRVTSGEAEAVRERFRAAWEAEEPVYVVPEDDCLALATVGDLVTALSGRLVYGGSTQLQSVARAYLVADTGLPPLLERLTPGAVVLTSADRADVVLGCLASLRSSEYPNIAGLVLTGGTEPPASVRRLVDGLRFRDAPVVSVEDDTWTCAEKIQRIRPTIGPGDDRRIADALALFEDHVDQDELVERVRVTRSDVVTPLRFEYELVQRAKQRRRHIVLPEGRDERILRAAEILLRRGVAELTILGHPAEIAELEAALGLDLSEARIVDPLDSEWRPEFAKTYHELREHKGITEEAAFDIVSDVSYFGTMMVYTGRADGMVSGAAHTTAHTIRPAFEFIRAREGVSVVSSVFLMCLEDRVLVYGDCAVLPQPTPAELADIAVSSAATARTFGIEPRVAMLSYSTGASGSGEDVEEVREAVKLVRERAPELPVEGPIQYDAAVDAGVARKKLPDSAVAGRATVFVFPDLNTGNNTYKAVQRTAGAVAIGPVLQGLRKPVNDLSRGCTVPDIVNTVAVTAIQAAAGEEA